MLFPEYRESGSSPRIQIWAVRWELVCVSGSCWDVAAAPFPEARNFYQPPKTSSKSGALLTRPPKPPPMATTDFQEQTILEIIEPSPSTAVTVGLPVTPIANKNEQGEVDFIVSRAFRIVREDCSVDIPAPLRKRDERIMNEVMGMAQREKSSGVFAFDPADVVSLSQGKKVLMIAVGGAELEFSRETFSVMTVEEVLNLTDENPVEL